MPEFSFQTIAIFILTSVGIYLAIAVGLILSQWPTRQDVLDGQSETLDFSKTQNQNLEHAAPLEELEIAGASPIQYRYYPAENRKRLILFIHGSGWHSLQYAEMANELSSKGIANIVTPDLRGHGFDPERRGDIDYIGQLEDDIAALIAHIKANHTINQVIIAGHSSGGGLVVRFAGGEHGDMADGWVLMAPFLQHDAPTMRQDAGGWSSILVRRIIGLSMLNQIGIRLLNRLTIIQFRMPKSQRDSELGHTATLAYSYRLNTSYAPRRDYGADLAKMTKPLLVLAGKEDEAFKAEEYEPTISKYTPSGTYKLLDGVSHLDITHNEQTVDAIGHWISKFLAR